jgi:uncharacterized membrane protein YdcZ (DUF606 family)
MGFIALLIHLLNFMAPALLVGFILAFLAPVLVRNRPRAGTYIAQTAINFIVGVIALAIGLVFFGRDGKMASYALLVLASAASQWWALRRS